jgi:hypothetical protein
VSANLAAAKPSAQPNQRAPLAGTSQWRLGRRGSVLPNQLLLCSLGLRHDLDHH